MRRRSTFTGIAIALAITATACGSGGSGGDAAVSIRTLQAAVSNTQHASTSRFLMDVSFDGSGRNVVIHADGVASDDGKQGKVTVTLPTLGSIEERVVDGIVYMDFGGLPFASVLPEGKHWLSVSADELKARTGTDLGSLDQAQNNSPRQGLEYLQGLSGDVEKVGDDTVAGEHATHYRASIDYAKVAAKLPSESSALADKLAKLGTVPADVWIDDHDRVVKMHFTIDGSTLGAEAGAGEFTMEITDFGVPIDVQAPPADETVDFLTLRGQTV